MTQKNRLLYAGFIAVLTGANGLFAWQFNIGLIGFGVLIVKDIIIIVLLKKLLMAGLKQYFAVFTDNIMDENADKIDLTIRFPEDTGATGEIATQFNNSIERTHNAIMDVEASVSRLIPMSVELADTYNAITQKTLTQTNYGQSVAGSMDKMHQASTTVSNDIEQINTAVVSSNEYVTSCRDAVDSTVQSIHIVSDNMEHASSELEKLKQASEEVSTVIEVINSIAEQTNLLALNAAIEAARAGEMGRGFAVVADEVRTLAERTRVSTSEVRDNIERIQAQTNDLVESMTQGKESTELTVQRSEESRQQLDEIFNAVEAIQLASNQINGSIVVQTEAANEAQAAISGLVELNTDALESTSIHAVSKEDLNNLAQALKDKLSVFKLNEHHWDESTRFKTPQQIKASAASKIEAEAEDVELF
ncbi:MAG: methyl-accepting chemotaxis protein [Sulfuriflexus sp.]|nr:methyl-accepting chemotaxis protein [Sulfuriflexus sp.]